MPKSTILQVDNWVKSRNFKKIKKIQKTLDKHKVEWYNTTEVERYF
jgi:hypothetical protein